MPPLAAKTGLIVGPLLVASGYFIAPVRSMLVEVHEYHFLGLVFLILIAVMLMIQRLAPRAQPWGYIETAAVDMTPWPLAQAVGAGLCALVLTLYVSFFNFH
jgi:SSS family solute:Na+ symporter